MSPKRALDAGLSPELAELAASVQTQYPVDTDDVEQPESNFLELYASAKKSVGVFQGQLEAFGQAVGFPAG